MLQGMESDAPSNTLISALIDHDYCPLPNGYLFLSSNPPEVLALAKDQQLKIAPSSYTPHKQANDVPVHSRVTPFLPFIITPEMCKLDGNNNSSNFEWQKSEPSRTTSILKDEKKTHKVSRQHKNVRFMGTYPHHKAGAIQQPNSQKPSSQLVGSEDIGSCRDQFASMLPPKLNPMSVDKTQPENALERVARESYNFIISCKGEEAEAKIIETELRMRAISKSRKRIPVRKVFI